MSNLQPLSYVVERLQNLSQSKHDDTIFTGTSFMDKYGQKEEIAFAGGDIQHAYSKVNTVYKMAKDHNKSKNKFKINNSSSINTEVLVGNLEIAIDKIDSAMNRLNQYDTDKIQKLIDELKQIKESISKHKEQIESTGIISL